MGGVVAQFLTKKLLCRKVNKTYKSDMEAFMELESQNGGALKTTDDLGRTPRMWDDWLAFKNKLKKNDWQEKEKRLQDVQVC